MMSDNGMRGMPQVRLQRTYIVELYDRRELVIIAHQLLVAW